MERLKKDFSEEEINKVWQCVKQELFKKCDGRFELEVKCQKILVRFLKKCLNRDESNVAVDNLASQWVEDGVFFPIDIPYSEVKPSKKDFSAEEIKKILRRVDRLFIEGYKGLELEKCYKRLVWFLKKCVNIDKSNVAVDNLAFQWVEDGVRFPIDILYSEVKPSKKDFSAEEIKKISQCVDWFFMKGLVLQERKISFINRSVSSRGTDPEEETTVQPEKRKEKFLDEASEKPLMKDGQKSHQAGQTPPSGFNEKYDADDKTEIGNESEPHPELAGDVNSDESSAAVDNLDVLWAEDGVRSPKGIPYSDVKPSKTDFSAEIETEKISKCVGQLMIKEEETTAQPERRKKTSLDEASEKPLMEDGQKSQQADRTPPSSYNEKYDADDKTEIGNESEHHSELAGGQAQSRLISLDSRVSYYPNERLSEESRVYKGRQRYIDGEFDCEIAFKVIPAAENNRCMREVENMKHVTGHPNVVQYFQCGRTENSNVGDFYIVLDLCQKETLGDIDMEKITPDERKKIFVQICQGVQHLHNRKVAHGDLRPRHILFSLDGKNAVIAGFGRSRKFKEGEDPVSCFGEDIFRLGCLGVYVLTGHHPCADGHTAPCWGVNSHKISTPKLDGLDPLEKDLFKRMLSHVPEERPSIDKVLHHCMFWSRKKTSQFLHDVYSYSRLSESLSEPLLLIDRYCRDFQSVPLENVKKNQLLMSSHSQQLANEAGIPGDWLKEVIRIRSWETEGQKEEEQTFNHLLRRKLFLNGGLKNLLHKWESERLGRKETLCNEVKKWYNETKSLIGLERRRKWYMLGYLTDSSLKELLKYLRRYSDKMEELLEAFPKLVPFLIRNMGPELEDEDKEEYLRATPQVKNLCLTEERMPTIIKQTISGISCNRSLTHPVVNPEVAVAKEKRKFL